MIKIYRGDDTDGAFGRHIMFTIKIEDGKSLDGCTAILDFGGVIKRFSDIESGKPVEIVFSSEETSQMDIGSHRATFKILDANGKVRTFDDNVPYCVTRDIREVYAGASSASVTIGKMIKWEDIYGRPMLTEEDEFDKSCDDDSLRERIGKLWDIMGGKVI